MKKMAILGNTPKMLSVGVYKALDCSRIHSTTRVYEDLKFLVSGWSVKAHTSITTWWEFEPTVKDFLNLAALPVYGGDKCDGRGIQTRR